MQNGQSKETIIIWLMDFITNVCTFGSWQSIYWADKYADICHTVVFICEVSTE